MSIEAFTEVTLLCDRYNIIVAEIRCGEQLRFDREWTVVVGTYCTKKSHAIDARLMLSRESLPHLLRKSRHDDHSHAADVEDVQKPEHRAD